MLNTVIIEDEKPAMENLIDALSSVSDDIHIAARLGSVKESIAYFSQQPDIGLIFSDVQLSDGLSFEIFCRGKVQTPVIFITGYDHFFMNAFESNGIDYLLKPVDKKDLQNALSKYKMLERHFTPHHALNNLLHNAGLHKKKRIVVKKGIENISLLIEDIVLFFTENKIVYVTDRCGKKYLADKNLSELELGLDHAVFFRVNRQFIVNINFIRSFKSFEKVKLQVELTLPGLNHSIIVSQELAPQFREWIHNA